uniref:Uncharacterized protein n=1 Tax=Anguilla anguilla TaxID=7936 RepID=A0A0E9U852_ANGAN
MVVERDTSQLSSGNNKTNVHNFFILQSFQCTLKRIFLGLNFPLIKIHLNRLGVVMRTVS